MSAELLDRFYTAFSQRDAAGMAACYHPEVRFSDPVFPDLEGWKAAAMWHMLCARGKDLTLEFSVQDAAAHWEADYTFSTTGRKVHNVIDATFEFRDGRILRHSDHFDFYAWSRMALGAPGLLLGWTPILRNKVRGTAAKGLSDWIGKQGLGPDLIPGI